MLSKADGSVIRVFPNARQASLFCKASNGGSNITDVCRGRLKTAYGHQWAFVDKPAAGVEVAV